MLEPHYLAQNNARRTAFRHELHQHPELSGQEVHTAQRIIKYLGLHTNASVQAVAGTGVLAIFDSGVSGNNILLRSDHDALPIQEVNTFDHASDTPNVSHKCGHDGHTTIMLGVAEALTDYPIRHGKATLLFQPAEENGMGAKAVLADKHFDIEKIDYAYALHNLPGFAKNNIAFKHQSFTAHIKSLIIKLKGKTAHAAEPEKGHNPDRAISELIQYCHKLTNNIPAQDDFFLITTVHTILGETAYGVSAGYAELHLTIRAWDKITFDKNCDKLLSMIDSTAKKHSLKTDLEWTQVFHANQNNKTAVENIKTAADCLSFSTTEIAHPFKWGEDFGLFTQRCKGAMFGIGAGESCPALHNPDYDFPDDITNTGINIFYQILKQHLID